ncbi:DUF4380 domain-containing protein [Streptomyces sp. NPDC059740]|uniref:DUF4380 domain-containing protein n=1 Tax=Streptomyces sp. NPDC059740 TaxID=3346926 RepID=UPI0036691056
MTSDRVRVATRDAGGHTVVDLTNGRLCLVLAPQLGGRLLSVRCDGREFLHRSPELLDEECGARDASTVGPHDGRMADWRNWGGDKTWPAPQGWSGPEQWAGPPDPVLDSGPYRVQTETDPAGEHVRATLTSAPDPRTGLQLRREVTLRAGATSYGLRLSATNTADHPVRWALWNVAQLPGHPPAQEGDGVWVGLAGEPGPAVRELVAGTGVPQVRTAAGAPAHVPAQDVVGKVGFPTAAGWVAHVGPAGTWVHRFPVTPGAAYPDGGSRAEIWLEHPLDEPLAHLGDLRPTHRIVECEVLGPLVTLDPGRTMELDTTVLLGPHGGAVADAGAFGWWNRPLTAERTPDGGVRLGGSFVPCTATGEEVVVRTGAGGTGRAHRTGVPVRAGEAVDLASLPPLAAVPAGTTLAVLLGPEADVPCMGRATVPD